MPIVQIIAGIVIIIGLAYFLSVWFWGDDYDKMR